MPLAARVNRRLDRIAEATLAAGNGASGVAGLLAELAENAALIRAQSESLAHFRKLFDSASAAARIGVWQCDLADERLTWTDVVYDLFDLPRGTPVDRAMILALYPESSRKALERVRRAAIEAGTGFQLDTEIRTAKGVLRWIRITATVECEDGRPVRIFGMKQDITAERQMADRLRILAEQDAMTGLANRGRFQTELERFDDPADSLYRCGALLLVDLDGFKAVNDTFGHDAGDELIRASARALTATCPEAVLVARVGGDEFGLIFDGADERAARGAADRLVAAIGGLAGPKGGPSVIGASIGIAHAAHRSGEQLFRAADAALYAAKAAGRGTFRSAPSTD